MKTNLQEVYFRSFLPLLKRRCQLTDDFRQKTRQLCVGLVGLLIGSILKRPFNPAMVTNCYSYLFQYFSSGHQKRFSSVHELRSSGEDLKLGIPKPTHANKTRSSTRLLISSLCQDYGRRLVLFTSNYQKVFSRHSWHRDSSTCLLVSHTLQDLAAMLLGNQSDACRTKEPSMVEKKSQNNTMELLTSTLLKYSSLEFQVNVIH